MRLNNKLGIALTLFPFFLTLIAFIGEPAAAFDCPPNYTGEPLTPDQKVTVQCAIDGIGMYPESITYMDAQGNVKTASTATIARRLQGELNNGQIQQEVQNNSAQGWEYCGEINIENGFLDKAGSDGQYLGYLQEILVHEWVHKEQGGSSPSSAKEVEATSAELAYKDSIGISPQDPERLWAYWLHTLHYYNYYWNWFFANLGRMFCQGFFIEPRSERPPNHDHLRDYHMGEQSCRDRDLGDYRVCDMHVLENYFNDSTGLLLLCGFMPGQGGRLLSFELSDSVADTFMVQDFPQYLHSIERIETTNAYLLVDTLTKQIYRMEDTNTDQLPDWISCVFTSAAQYPQLAAMQSVETAIHPVYGYGWIVHPEPIRHFSLIGPYDQRWFLADADGDHVADQCHPVRRCEFMKVLPQIYSTPFAGDMAISIFGTWNHDIVVHACDETGEILYDVLAVTHLMDSIQTTVILSRPLLLGEYIIAIDMAGFQHSPMPTQVQDTAPQAVVIQYNPEIGLLRISWEAVPGTASYALYASDDGVEFFDTGLRTTESFFELPYPAPPKQFFYVTSIR